MLKILQVRLQQYVNPELPDVQAGFKKGGGTRNQIGTTYWIIEKAMGIPEKASPSSSLTKLKPLTVWITANRGKFFKRWEHQTTLPVSWGTYMWVWKQQLEPYTEQFDWFRIGKGVRQGCILSLKCRVHLVTCWTGWSRSWNQDCREKYLQPQIGIWYHCNGRM